MDFSSCHNFNIWTQVCVEVISDIDLFCNVLVLCDHCKSLNAVLLVLFDYSIFTAAPNSLKKEFSKD